MSRAKYSPELRERNVRMVFDHTHEHPSQRATIRSVAEKLGCTVEALRRWVRQAERDAGHRPHNSGRGAKYTAGWRPVRLVYQEAFRSLGKARAHEYAVKQLTRAQKDAMVVSARRRHH